MANPWGKPKYKLSIIAEYGDEELHIVTIGKFNTERELQQWAEDNLGEIDNV